MTSERDEDRLHERILDAARFSRFAALCVSLSALAGFPARAPATSPFASRMRPLIARRRGSSPDVSIEVCTIWMVFS